MRNRPLDIFSLDDSALKLSSSVPVVTKLATHFILVTGFKILVGTVYYCNTATKKFFPIHY